MKKKEARGIGLRNPLNIRKTKDMWVGQEMCNEKERFCLFVAKQYCYRAGFIILKHYIMRGLDTISKMISTWAPPTENDTEGYIRFVARYTGHGRDAKVSFLDRELMLNIMRAMIQMESGFEEELGIIENGYDMVPKNNVN